MNIQYKTTLKDEVSISYIVVNENLSGVPIVIIPGAVNSAEEIVEAFDGKLTSYHIIISLRGRGKSSSPVTGYSLSDQASDIQAVIECEKIESFVLFGHSVGSTIGIRAARNFPNNIKALVMGDFPPFYPPFDENWVAHVLSYGDGIDITPIALHGIARDAEYIDVIDELNALKCDSYAIKASGEDSLLRTEDAQKLQELCPRCTILELPESGHEMIRDNPIELARILESISKQFE
ncbi:MAG: alpha/beta hydrolase [Ignavibacteria bacterium]|nr:alpha/beta hydrolase [Ignavibacteria bacterium]